MQSIASQPQAREGGTPNARSPEQALEAVRRGLERALAVDPELAARLTRAHTTARLKVQGAAGGLTLRLDGDAPAIGDEVGDTDVDFTLTPERAHALATGELPLAPAAFAGLIGLEGSPRRFLEVAAILQGLIARSVDREPGPTGLRGPGRAQASTAAPDELLAIHAEGIGKAFGDHVVLDGVDLTIPEGVISVVLGPSGTGKSVLLEHLIGILPVDRGRVSLRGTALHSLSRRELMRLRQMIGVMFQDGALFSSQTVFDNVAFPLREHSDLSEREIREIVTSRLSDVGLADAADTLPRELSGGMRKRAGLARALVLDPSILLCDEPDSGLDPVRTALVGDLLTAHHARSGGMILVVTHDIALAKQIADHVSVLWRGRIVASGLAADVFASEDPFVRQFLDGRVDGPLEME